MFICDECIGICARDYGRGAGPVRSEDDFDTDINLLKPEEIHKILDDYVIGQDEAKKLCLWQFIIIIKRITAARNLMELQKSNILMLGPTGSGKTLLAQTLARLSECSFCHRRCHYTDRGRLWGEDVENILLKIIQAAIMILSVPSTESSIR